MLEDFERRRRALQQMSREQKADLNALRERMKPLLENEFQTFEAKYPGLVITAQYGIHAILREDEQTEQGG